MTDFFVRFRNMTCFMFTWLSILIMAGAYLSGQKDLAVSLLFKLFTFSLLTSLLLVTVFSDIILRKKSFIFRLTVLFLLFIPMEILFFYWVGLFSESGSILTWGFFVLIVAVFYFASLIIDRTIIAKKGMDYTKKLEDYKSSNCIPK